MHIYIYIVWDPLYIYMYSMGPVRILRIRNAPKTRMQNVPEK